MESPEFQAKLTGMGIDPIVMTQLDFARYVASELEKWSKVVELFGAQVD